ncbi:hypothetical protein IAQ61_001168, partial [Plenodomus lingam]|uniref:uncharacterized protein n=1 Tax=Leptosphaeria maculans TaxID=5022 RepID=UPI00331C8CB8
RCCNTKASQGTDTCTSYRLQVTNTCILNSHGNEPPSRSSNPVHIRSRTRSIYPAEKLDSLNRITVPYSSRRWLFGCGSRVENFFASHTTVAEQAKRAGPHSLPSRSFSQVPLLFAHKLQRPALNGPALRQYDIRQKCSSRNPIRTTWHFAACPFDKTDMNPSTSSHDVELASPSAYTREWDQLWFVGSWAYAMPCNVRFMTMS